MYNYECLTASTVNLYRTLYRGPSMSVLLYIIMNIYV